MRHRRFSLSLVASMVVLAPLGVPAAEPEIVSVEKIWDKGEHNAFTDLIRWHDKWYCTFREADAHVGGDGKLRVLESADGEKWEPAALIAEEGIDLRDPKLSITPDDRLMIVAGGSVYEGTKTLKGRQPRVAFSKDGRDVDRAAARPRRGRVALARHLARRQGLRHLLRRREPAPPAAKEAAETGKVDPARPIGSSSSSSAHDGVKYDLVTHLDVPGHPNETTVRFLPDGEMIALVRREGGNKLGWIGTQQGRRTRSGPGTRPKHRLGGPNFIRLPDGSLWAGRPQLPRRREDRRGPDDRRRRTTGPDPPQRRRHQLPRPRLARRPSLDELLLLARGQDVDLPGQDQASPGISNSQKACPTEFVVHLSGGGFAVPEGRPSVAWGAAPRKSRATAPSPAAPAAGRAIARPAAGAAGQRGNAGARAAPNPGAGAPGLLTVVPPGLQDSTRHSEGKPREGARVPRLSRDESGNRGTAISLIFRFRRT